MHSLHFGGFNMHFNSDLSGDVEFDWKGEKPMKIPGELIRSYIRRYVLGRLRDSLKDLLYNQLDEYKGLNNKDRLFVLEQIDHIDQISQTTDPTSVLHGTCYLLGSRVHITFIRVKPDGPEVGWVAEDSAFQEDLDTVQDVAGSQGRLEAIEVPGYQGKYIAYTYPYEE